MHIVQTPSIVRGAVRTAWGNVQRALETTEIEARTHRAALTAVEKKMAVLKAQLDELDHWLAEHPE